MKSFLLFVFCYLSFVESKVVIYSHYFDQPEFIKYQHKLFEKNLLNEYELVVIEDSKNPEVSLAIENECIKYGIQYIHIPEDVFNDPKFLPNDPWVGIHSPSFECSVATQYIYDNFVLKSENISLILDNDIFLVAPFDVETYLKDCAFAYPPQNRGSVEYMLPNFIIFDPQMMKDKESLSFNMGTIEEEKTDSGGHTCFYLRKYRNEGKTIPIYSLAHIGFLKSSLKEEYFRKYSLLFNSEEWGSHFFVDYDTFLHMRMGSNWSRHPQYYEMKTEMFSFLEELMSSN